MSIFFLIFAIMLVLYGGVLAKWGNGDLIPYQVVHSIRNKDDVKRVGKTTMIVGLVIAVVALALFIFSSQ